MSQLSVFIAHHWILWAAFFSIVLILIVVESQAKLSGGRMVSPTEAVQLMNHQQAVVIDIRKADDFKKSHIIHSVSFPFEQLTADIDKLKKYQKKPLLLLCTAGITAQKAAKILLAKEFKEVQVIAGGMNAWQRASLPTESLESVKGETHGQD